MIPSNPAAPSGPKPSCRRPDGRPEVSVFGSHDSDHRGPRSSTSTITSNQQSKSSVASSSSSTSAAPSIIMKLSGLKPPALYTQNAKASLQPWEVGRMCWCLLYVCSFLRWHICYCKDKPSPNPCTQLLSVQIPLAKSVKATERVEQKVIGAHKKQRPTSAHIRVKRKVSVHILF